MNTYFSTFGSGLSEVIKPALIKHVKGVDIKLLLDGLVVYSTSKAQKEVKQIRFFNNTFTLIKSFEGLGRNPMGLMTSQTLSDPELIKKARKNAPLEASDFRIIASKENQLIAIDKSVLTNLEKLFSKTLNLRVNRANPDIEVWFLSRSEGFGFLGIRITRTPNYEKVLDKGELKPELANILCLISEPNPQDVVLDPFAGYGAIPIELVNNFPFKQVVASEKSKQVFKILYSKIKKAKQKIVVGRWDALNLSSLTDNSIDKIVTDPPWGIFSNQGVNLERFYKPVSRRVYKSTIEPKNEPQGEFWNDFYENMLKEFIRVLKGEGLIVVLMGQKELFEKALIKFKELELLMKYNILVSGKKAAIYKIKKMPNLRGD